MTETETIPEAKWQMAMPKMPTAEQHRAVALQWLERVQPTLIDRWPAELAALSMPTTLVPVEPDIIEAIWDLQDGGPIEALSAFAARLDAEMGWDRKFVRLNSRSPKDSPFPFSVPATMSGKEAVSILAGSMRVLDDLYEFKRVPEQPAYVCLREFLPWIRGENEFRCFVKDDQLIAVSHYDYTKPVPQYVLETLVSIRAKIEAYFIDKLSGCLPVATVVFDVAIDGRGELLLIEINPFGLSDPCWFGSYENVLNATGPIQVSSP